MKATTHQRLLRRKRRIEKRLERANRRRKDRGRPVFAGGDIRYELAGRGGGLACGGIGAIHTLVGHVGLAEEVDRKVHVLKRHQPYHESDHVLNIAYNVIAGGSCLRDLELRRNDEQSLDAMGAECIPDPTTAGDFCPSTALRG